MPVSQCKALLDTCTVRVYSENAFRILNAPVDVSPRRLKRCASDLQAAIDLDELAEEYPRFLRPRPLPASESIRRASHQLQDPLLRFVHEFFWFWPMQWGRSASDEGLLALKAHGARQAESIWVPIATKGTGQEACVAKHNLAVLWHFLALRGELHILEPSHRGTTIPPDEEKRLDLGWQYAFKYWEALCPDEAFWRLLAGHDGPSR